MTLPEQPTAPLIELIFDRLAADDVPTDTAELVLAALTGDDDLTAALGGSPTRLDPRFPTNDEPSERIWLKSVTVAGFRGVGPERTLDIAPGPGITLVVGRNGSGKSSFAEAVELALTGDSARWADKTSVWRTGWRNLHAQDPCRIGVELRVDGEATPTRVARAWPAGGELADAEVTVTSARGRRDDLTELGLARPLELYRPFLTAAELGRLAAGTQSQLFDALFAILGLDALTDADQRLMRAARPHDAALKEVRAQRAALADLLAEVADDRARRAAVLLRQTHHLIDDLTVPDGPGSPTPTGSPLRGIGMEVPRAGDGAEALLGALREAVTALRGVPGEPADLADHLAARYPALVAAADAARAYAEGFLRQRDTGWRAAAAELSEWVAAAGGLAAREATLARVKAARAWLKETGAAVRDERIAPFAAHSQRIWEQLRQESNVELGAMTLAGTNTRRRVVFPVSVDGADNGTALGVMSQGEMQALGLATFLPRSCAPESPFRFIVVDDPVQSMDPSKVDGLARVLAELAEDRQVVVFTHDTRLPDAVRRLDLGRARIVEVQRAEQSVVTLRAGSDPVTRYLDDAWALARNDELPADVRGPVVAELCRSAVEAACHLRVWRTRVTRGVPHDDVEAAIVDASRRLTTIVALAVFDDADRGGDVLGWLGRHGGWAVGAYRACREGVHGAYLADLAGLVTDARALAKVLA
ncbi:AAA family ATPase [Micromonospora purpureochromogenes]|uniref:AAA family ATPase n=1 Tax=Micromonospora purpureochromogenes TaxID=47872 RepID=UPI0033E1307B